MHQLIHIAEHAFFDSVKLVPSLFIIYFLIEFFEHRHNNRMHHLFMKTKRSGPVFGGLLGCIPQCGFSVIAAELFSGKYITLGTLVAVFTATSDEAIPMLIAEPDMLPDLAVIIAIKLCFAVVFGFIVDAVYRTRTAKVHICECEHTHFHGNCEDCHGGALRSTVIHTIRVFVFILIASLLLGLLSEYASELVYKISVSKWLQPFFTAAVGLVPSCAASVMVTKLYIDGTITFAALTGGLCSGAGVGLLVLFRLNKNKRQNTAVVILMYLLGVISGLGLTAFAA